MTTFPSHLLFISKYRTDLSKLRNHAFYARIRARYWDYWRKVVLGLLNQFSLQRKSWEFGCIFVSWQCIFFILNFIVFQRFLKCSNDSASLTYHSIHLPVANVCYITRVCGLSKSIFFDLFTVLKIFGRSCRSPTSIFPWPPYLDNVLGIRLWIYVSESYMDTDLTVVWNILILK